VHVDPAHPAEPGEGEADRGEAAAVLACAGVSGGERVCAVRVAPPGPRWAWLRAAGRAFV